MHLRQQIITFCLIISVSWADSIHTFYRNRYPPSSEEDYYYNEDYHETIPKQDTAAFVPNPPSSDDAEGRLAREGMCSNVNEIHRSIKALDCSKPVLKTVKLRPPAPNFAIVPSVAQVKRCAGHCNHPRSCLPSKTSTIRIPVYKFDKSNVTNKQTCVEYELLQHEECRCKCAVESHHCSKHQTYDANNCACSCKVQEEKHKCLEMQFSNMEPLRYWDDLTCECKCIPKSCGRLRVWVPSMCRCMQIPTGEEDENALF
ncbi:uncharacterized protein LOC110851488 isoform X2 [Folsomia candida]|uniref:uncharacterized protein LOC110851488 isoform X2 n=1 Tax=Folsomia candida TaxID=158441 RepID=UPI000B8FD908|nr:uncharacterized protein LOC110851488 isoform X2 [Folsomia candida]